MNMPSNNFFLRQAIYAAVQTAMPTWVKEDGAPKTLRYLVDVVTMTDDSWFRELVIEKYHTIRLNYIKQAVELRI